ncbi:hypothetical protein EV702DRAFT_1206753 [Suillus placidus]|uniref:Uncharacterized protein n=1 Tax=Suillus placidus TaxID=48579 RepID=A0A9P7CVH1_9AGAM|nr:hypothetical protein EV702DRAFT_1206753 [Suillus placidus]
MLHSLYSIFSSFADLVCHHRYKSQWNTVEHPKSMSQRLAKLDDNQQKSSTRSLDESSYVFPDPLVSMPNVQQLSTHMPTISDIKDWTRDSMGSEFYTFSSACPSNVMPLSSTRSSLHSLSDDGHELKVLDEPVYRTSTARQPQITSTENVPQMLMHGHHQACNLVADSPPHLCGPTQHKQHSTTSALHASRSLPQTTSSESVAHGSQSPASHEFIISPCSPPLKYRPSPLLPQNTSSESVQHCYELG